MSKETDISTEQKILEAAENEFLTKGFSGAKTTEIAKSAGVTHAMLHYYFRTKENLFNMVFERQAVTLANSFISVFEQELPLLEKLKIGIEQHFDIIAANPKLPFFIFSEILIDDNRKNIFVKALLPKVGNIVEVLQADIDKEVQNNTIKPIGSVDLMLNIMSLNIFIFIAQPALSLVFGNSGVDYESMMEHRKKNNVDLIISSLKK